MLVHRFVDASPRLLGLVLTPALLVALTGCSMQARPMQAGRTPATPQSGATAASPARRPAPPPVDPGARSRSPRMRQALRQPDPFAPWSAPGGSSGNA